MSNPLADLPKSLELGLRRLEVRWGWFAAFGLLMIGLGLLSLALVASATIASVFVIGLFMILTGGVEIAIGLGARNWGRLALWVATGVLYAAAGLVAIARPAMAAAVFTLILGAGLAATGVLRLFLATHLPSGGSRWLAFLSSAVTLLLATAILIGWPSDSVFVLGTLLGVDLFFAGSGWLSLGLALRLRAKG